MIAGCDLTHGQSANQWFNPSCYLSPSSTVVGPGYGFGHSPVGNLRSMRFQNVDFALAKNISITESKMLQFRFEAFNVLNHMVLAVPGNSNGTSAPSIAPTFSNGAGSYGSAAVISNIANTPRELQLAAKFIF